MHQTKIKVRGLKVRFGKKEVLAGIDLDVYANHVLGLMGPSASGKSSFISVINGMINFEDDGHFEGRVDIDGYGALSEKTDHVALRKKVGTVFATPIPLPRSIFENVAFGSKLKGVRRSSELAAIVEESLKKAFLWDEVKYRLSESALKLSGGQQQRLCLARTLALKPEIILLDEPCSGLDPISTAKIEEALSELKRDHTIVLVSNNTKQIARASDFVAFFYMGKLVEFGPTVRVFTNPEHKLTEDYVLGKFG
ncbi:MAG: phosphate ABC transporter ATP-binding protein [Syntrophorhabdales bacterium]|jgi:phosphate transport system ATP-binding protein